MKNKPTSILFLFLTAIIWGFAFVAQVAGGAHLGTFYFNGIRFIIGAISLIPVILLFERGGKESNKITVLSGIVAGIILFTAANLQQWGINITGSSGKGGFLTALYTVFVPILSAIFLKKRTNRNSWLGAVLALIGLFLILSGSMSSNDTPFFSAMLRIVTGSKSFTGTLTVGFGDLVLLLCALAFAVHIVFIDYFNKSIRPIKFSCTQFFTCGILSLVIAFFTESISAEAVQGALIPLLYGGIMSTGVAYTLQIIGQRGAHPTVSAIILSTESMFAAIGGALLLHERLSNAAYIGCAIILAGIILAQIPTKARK
ncbi:MAG: DMT family transporter [Eubacteriales bacterium]